MTQLTESNIQNCGNAFSPGRLRMVFRFWWPTLQRYLLVFFLCSVAISVVTSLVALHNGSLMAYQFAGVPAYFAVFGSAVFGSRKGREQSIVLPATSNEKATFMLLYTLVALPLVSYVTSGLISYFISGETMVNMAIESVHLKYSSSECLWFFGFSLLVNLMAALTCLYFAVMSRTHIYIKSIGLGFVVMSAPSFLVGFMAGIGTFNDLDMASMSPVFDPSLTVSSFFEKMMAWIKIMVLPIVVIIAGIIVLFYQRFPRRQP